MSFASYGKVLVILGIAIVALGVAFLFFDKIPFLGKLPGDIIVKRRNFAFYFPLATSILISLLLTAVFLIINLLRK
ncbi:MAG: hypothetical protein A2W25_02045 [candidate division Zixibacteria bacterium RBG_16_53_22]|nr:MAG: hypothetical protein A2W25_02045 [candidate division Zixibacteria bacterium RBG_16_53_22]